MLPWPDATHARTQLSTFFLYELVIELTLRVTLTAPRPVVKATCLDNGRARYIPLYAPSLVEVMKV